MTIMEDIAKSIMSFDYEVLYNKVHSLKGAVSYCAAGRMFDITYKILKACDNKDYEKMFDYEEGYPELLSRGVEFRIARHQLIYSENGSDYEISPEHETLPCPEGYRVEKVSEGKYRTIVSETE